MPFLFARDSHLLPSFPVRITPQHLLAGNAGDGRFWYLAKWDSSQPGGKTRGDLDLVEPVVRTDEELDELRGDFGDGDFGDGELVVRYDVAAAERDLLTGEANSSSIVDNEDEAGEGGVFTFLTGAFFLGATCFLGAAAGFLATAGCLTAFFRLRLHPVPTIHLHSLESKHSAFLSRVQPVISAFYIIMGDKRKVSGIGTILDWLDWCDWRDWRDWCVRLCNASIMHL